MPTGMRHMSPSVFTEEGVIVMKSASQVTKRGVEQWILKKRQDVRNPSGMNVDGGLNLSLVLLPPSSFPKSGLKGSPCHGTYSPQTGLWNLKTTAHENEIISVSTDPKIHSDFLNILLGLCVLFDPRELTYRVLPTYEDTPHEELSVILDLIHSPLAQQEGKGYIPHYCRQFNKAVRGTPKFSLLPEKLDQRKSSVARV